MVIMLVLLFIIYVVLMNMRLFLLGIFDVKKEYGDVYQIQVVVFFSGNVVFFGYYFFYVVYNGVLSVGEWIQIV